MAKAIEIQCINKQDRDNAWERITHVGGNQNGKWRITQQDAINMIEADEWQFYSSVNGESVWVVIAVSRFGNKYLKTQPDGEHPNNLLSLPECPKA